MLRTPIRKAIFLVLFGGLAILSCLLFVPAHYSVPAISPRPGMQYWQLATGSKIAYNKIPAQGVKKPYPVIYLHGGPGGPLTSSRIELLRPLAADGYDVYLYDQVGSGYSSRLANIREYTADRHRRDLAEIVRQTGAEKVILMGQSWGAILATLYAAADTGRVAGIIFTSPGPIQPIRRELRDAAPPDSLHLRPPLYTNAEGSRQAATLRTSFVTFLAQRFGWKLAGDDEMDAFYTKLAGLTNRSTVCDTARSPAAEGGGGFYVQVMTVASFAGVADPRPALRHATFPVLVMKGTCDNQPWGYTAEYLDVFPNHRLAVIPGAGHSISVEQPAAFIDTIREFLRNF